MPRPQVQIDIGTLMIAVIVAGLLAAVATRLDPFVALFCLPIACFLVGLRYAHVRTITDERELAIEEISRISGRFIRVGTVTALAVFGVYCFVTFVLRR